MNKITFALLISLALCFYVNADGEASLHDDEISLLEEDLELNSDFVFSPKSDDRDKKREERRKRRKERAKIRKCNRIGRAAGKLAWSTTCGKEFKVKTYDALECDDIVMKECVRFALRRINRLIRHNKCGDVNVEFTSSSIIPVCELAIEETILNDDEDVDDETENVDDDDEIGVCG